MKDPRTEFNYSGTRTQFIKKKKEETPNYIPQGTKSTSGVFDKSYFMGLVSHPNQVSYLLPTPETDPTGFGSALWHMEIKNKVDYHSWAEKTIGMQISS